MVGNIGNVGRGEDDELEDRTLIEEEEDGIEFLQNQRPITQQQIAKFRQGQNHNNDHDEEPERSAFDLDDDEDDEDADEDDQSSYVYQPISTFQQH